MQHVWSSRRFQQPGHWFGRVWASLFRGRADTEQPAMLDDFFQVSAVDRFVGVPAVGRFLYVGPADRLTGADR